MNTAKLNRLESELDALTTDEQWLIFDSLTRRLRHRSNRLPASFESDMTAMAHDPEIQLEVRAIEREFAPALLDGLAETN